MWEESLGAVRARNTDFLFFLKKYFCLLTGSVILCFTYSFSSAQSTQNSSPSGYYFRAGLENSQVRDVLQDRQGFLWIGTNDGLYQYDGYNFKKYIHDPNDSNTISNNQIRALYEDNDERLWVGTYGGGINILDKGRRSFTHYFHDPDDPGSLSFDEIMFIFKDSRARLWIGTDGGGVNQYLPEKKAFLHYEHQQDNPSSLSHNNVLSIGEDREGYLWLGTWYGLNRMDPATGKCVRFYHKENDEYTLSTDHVWEVEEVIPKKLWIRPPPQGIDVLDITSGKVQRNGVPLVQDEYVRLLKKENDRQVWLGSSEGLKLLNPLNNSIKRFVQDPLDNTVTEVTSLLTSSGGIVWIGLQDGLAKIDAYNTRFNFTQLFPVDDSGNQINTLYEDSLGIFWLGTPRGLVKYNPENQEQKLYPLPGNAGIQAFCADERGYFWIGTDAGLYRFYQNQEKFQPFVSEKFQSVSGRVIFEIFNDHNNTIWVGTILGLNKITFEGNTPKVVRYENDPNNTFSLVYSHHTSVVYRDQDGALWIGTNGGGISRFDPETEKFHKYMYDATDAKSLSNNFVECVYEDQSGNLWIGTQAGLNKLNKNTGKFQRFTTASGLDNYWINSIMGDDHGYLWLSTPGGITRFNPENETFDQYDKDDGLISNEFISKASWKSKNGTLYFGTAQGLISFHPDSIQKNPVIPPVVITSFNLFNEPVVPGTGSPLQKPVGFTDSIKLTYRQSSFSFEYVALNYTNSKKNQYSYKLEGFDEHWNNVGGERKATYTNVNPGEYVFRVKGSNNDGVWNEKGAAVHLTILPPFWQTTWAYLLYAVLFALGLYTLYYYLTAKADKKNQLDLERMQMNQAHELNQLKIRFFTNISHEIRTPLTLILSPLEKMLRLTREGEFPLKKQLDLVYRNAQRLQDLVNQLIDFRKLESGNLMLEPAFDNLSLFVKNVYESFAGLAEERRIQYQLDLEAENIWAYFDADKLEKILGNLLSNAFKFTPKYGSIMLRFESLPTVHSNEVLKSSSDRVRIIIKDTGVGIQEKELPHIFDPFYQGGSSNPHKQASSGIGLALTKELVNLHQGELTVESVVNQGTRFTLILPVAQQEALVHWKSLDNDYIQPVNGSESAGQASRPVLLVVDDNDDIRNFIAENLEDQYKIIQASNGKMALKKVLEENPDLIISDIMMPGMDGITLCKRLKADEKTSHIPLILLTASSSDTNRLKGLTTGADDYVQKPFNIFVLKARLQNLLTTRQRFREKYSKEITLEPTNTIINSSEAGLLDDIIAIIEKHMEDTDFNVSVLCRELGISRPQLYRKLQSLTGQSVNEFVRTIRLKRAAQLLRQGNLKIAEVAYHVGFNDPQYFSRCFKKQFGVSPTQMTEEMDS